MRPSNSPNVDGRPDQTVGILPLIHLKSLLFGNALISMPYADCGGILADDENAEKALIDHAVNLGRELAVHNIELRQIQAVPWLDAFSPLGSRNGSHFEYPANGKTALRCTTKSHKVSMLLELPKCSDVLFKSLRSKLRSQIKKPLKEGLRSVVGGHELIEDFYRVFSLNMRDLGSPVHSKRLIQNLFQALPDASRIVMVYQGKEALAGSVVIGFRDVLMNPWASSLREYNRLSPNMLLYWTMLEYACDKGFALFDFGRSTPEEGTYRFKEQWGAKPRPLNWQCISLRAGRRPEDDASEKQRFSSAISYWQKLPVPIASLVGPLIRKHISL
jgi:serine/alanine adding enzyme